MNQNISRACFSAAFIMSRSMSAAVAASDAD
jgi:hypothetical protein